MNEPMNTSHMQSDHSKTLASHGMAKVIRATQACDPCRRRKTRCDGRKPKCTHCQTSDQQCIYTNGPPWKGKPFRKLVQTLDLTMGKLDGVVQNIEVIKSQLEEVLRSVPFPRDNSLKQARIASPAPSSARSVGRETSDVLRERERSLISDSSSDIISLNDSPTTQKSLGNEKEKITNQPIPRVCSATAVQSLFGWPSIKQLLPTDHDEYDVTEMEKAGTSVWSHGSGRWHTMQDGHATPGNSTGNRIAVGIPSGPHSPVLTSPTPAYTVPSIDHYFESYRRNIHILHPIIDEATMRVLAASAKRDHAISESQFPMSPFNTLKRKRDEMDLPIGSYTTGRNLSSRAIHPESYKVQSMVSDALVLLILALGEICSYKKPFRRQIPSSPINTCEPLILEPFDSSSLPLGISDSRLDPKLAVSTWNGREMQTWERSISDAVPGRASYIAAVDILDQNQDGNHIMLVQAYLLAGLYAGQLTQVLASHAWIAEACRLCQVLIISGYFSSAQHKLNEQFRIAYWSCVQLESDILAEIDLPRSGISQFEAILGQEWLTGGTVGEEGYHRDDPFTIMVYYTSQIQLRKIINLHTHLNGEPTDKSPNFVFINLLNQYLEDWRNSLPDMKWNDEQHQSPDINTARMRAKYYGAKYLIYRPALQYALAYLSSLPSIRNPIHPPATRNVTIHRDRIVETESDLSIKQTHASKDGNSPQPLNKTHPQLWRACEQCVRAAIRSTTVLDQVPKALIVTNVFGTAQAQFGNLLVIVAVFTSPLTELIEPGELRHLLYRTIQFLRENQEDSPTLKRNVAILSHISNLIFLPATAKSYRNNI